MREVTASNKINGEGRDAPDAKAFSCNNHGEASCRSVACRADIHLQPVEDPTLEQVSFSKEGCDPVGSLYWSKVLAGPVASWKEEPMLDQFYWQDL